MRKIFLFISIFSVSILSCGANVEQIQILNGNVQQKTFFLSDYKNNITKCDDNKNCSIFYREDKNYCKKLEILKDDIDYQVRNKWECPRYGSIDELKQYGVLLTNNPVFSEYTFNLVKIFNNFEYIKKDSKIFFANLYTEVGLTPNNIMIPNDINDIVVDITINLGENDCVKREYYKMKNGDFFERQYVYKGSEIIKIIETSIDNEGSHSEEYIFKYFN